MPDQYAPLTPARMFELAAIQTWPATLSPVLVSFVLAYVYTSAQGMPFDVLSAALLLIICILLQSAANTINDYIDYKKGADTTDNQVDKHDAVLVYYHVNPAHVLIYFWVLIALAFLCGVYIISKAGFVPLLFAVLGVVVILLYSVGKTPLSYIPAGELASGITMGVLMPLACIYALTYQVSALMLFQCLPLMVGIALIMLTNNTCDIEKDRDAGRKTFASLKGRPTAQRVYRASLVIWALFIVANICCLSLTVGLHERTLLAYLVLIMTVLAGFPSARALWINPLTLPTRVAAFGAIGALNIIWGFGYACTLMWLL